MSQSFARVADVASFAYSTYTPLFRLQASLVAQNSQSIPPEIFDSAAFATAVTNLIVAMPFQHTRGRTSIPDEIAEHWCITEEGLSDLTKKDRLTPATQDMANIAIAEISKFQTMWKTFEISDKRRTACSFLQMVRGANACLMWYDTDYVIRLDRKCTSADLRK